jgi:hypothetical protein
MDTCTVTKNMQVVEGTRADYESLSHYHYRESHLGPCAAIFALKGKFRTAHNTISPQLYVGGFNPQDTRSEATGLFRKPGGLPETIGVIIYSMPTAGAQMRNIATGGIFAGLDRTTQIKLINKNIRTISRVIIEPRFRSLGLAVRLVKETMPLLDVPFIESLAVMGRANPFFEKAGLTRFDAPILASCVRLIEAFSVVGVDEEDLIDAALVQQKLDLMIGAQCHCERSEAILKHSMRPAFVTPAKAGVQKASQLDSYVTTSEVEGSVKIYLSTRLRLARNDSRDSAAEFIESEMVRFLKSYGRRRLMQPGIERTRFILNKLTDRPVYYLWRNPQVELRM